MIIYLYTDHTAAAVDDRSHTVQTIPPTDGVLEVAGGRFPVTADGRSFMPPLEDEGCVHGVYTACGGIRYTLINPKVNREGVPVSCIEERRTMFEMRERLDRIEKAIGDITKTVHDLRGIYERDALWFVTNKTEKEDTP